MKILKFSFLFIDNFSAIFVKRTVRETHCTWNALYVKRTVSETHCSSEWPPGRVPSTRHPVRAPVHKVAEIDQSLLWPFLKNISIVKKS